MLEDLSLRGKNYSTYDSSLILLGRHRVAELPEIRRAKTLSKWAFSQNHLP